MTDERKRSADVYELLKDHRQWVERKFDSLGESVDEIADVQTRMGRFEETQSMVVETVDVLADSVIGNKIPDPYNPEKWKLNGKGRPERDTTTGLAHLATKLKWQNQLWKFVGQLAAILGGVALIVVAFGGS